MESEDKYAEEDDNGQTELDLNPSTSQKAKGKPSQIADYHQSTEDVKCQLDMNGNGNIVKGSQSNDETPNSIHRFASAERQNLNKHNTVTSANDVKGLNKGKNFTSSVPDAKSKKVGQYLLGETIGEGSYGKVRLATHFISKQQVAIKVVTKKMLVVNEAARRNFRREALLLHHVTHPNIVRLYEAMETSNSYYLVFELATGGNVLALLSQRGSLSEEESRHYMRQVVSAVDHIHRFGIVHRDLKLENFLLDDKNNIKLVDFGLGSVCHTSDHQLNTQCGSPVYAAPELFAGRKYGQLVDVWSLGVCLFAMLTGRLPFLPNDEHSLPQLYSLIIKGCVIPGYLSPSCQNLLRRMLELQETRRITMEEILVHHWLLYPSGQPIKRVPTVPKKLNDNAINLSIVKYMCTMYRFSENDVITSVLDRKLSASAATYNILKDNMEKGKVSISFPRERSQGERMTSSTKKNGSFPAIDTNKVSISSEDPLAANDFNHNPTSHSHVINGTDPKREDSAGNNSYKSCILVLKRSRQNGLQSRLSGTHQDNLDYVLVGKFPRNKTIKDTRYSLPNLHSPALPNLSMPLTFPPITSSGGATSVGQRHTMNDNQGKRHYFHRNQAKMVELDVRGVSPCVYDRSSPFYPTGVAAYVYSNNSGHASSFSINGLHPNRTPPPPPPNSSFGNYSNQSKSPTEAWYQDQHSLNTNTKAHTRHIEGHVSNSDLSRFPRDPARPSLATLRDPFGRDTWMKSKLGKSRVRDWKPPRLRSKRSADDVSLHSQSASGGTRASSGDTLKDNDHLDNEDFSDDQIQNPSLFITQQHLNLEQSGSLSGFEVDATSDNAESKEDQHTPSIHDIQIQGLYMKSYPNSISSNSHQGNNDEAETGPATPTPQPADYFTTPTNSPNNSNDTAELPVHSASGKASPTWSRQDTDSPLEREDFMTPVTRVTITTIGRH